jgi:pyruvate dehydrogenase E2 component (dihydrolipoamide acetyltransferase)
MSEFRMPSLGADMDSGKLVEWRVKPGDEVHRGDIIAVVDTDKADIEVEVFEDGVIEELLVPVGPERISVGTPLATITANGKPVAAAPVEPAPVAAAPVAPAPVATAPIAALPPRGAHRRVSPLARRVAEALGVDVATIDGTGPGGAVTKADVERAAPAPGTPHPAPGTRHPAPETPHPTPDRSYAMRHAIGALMARSKREIPHYYLETHIDMSVPLGWLERENLERPVQKRLLAATLLIKASALAAREVPELNGFWVDDAFQPSQAVHVGVAISLREGGLIAPAIHDADTLTLDELMEAMRDLVGRARRGALRASEMSDPTITVTNLGEQGVESVFGVIYPPQVALVGFGKVIERPWAVDGMLGVRPVMTATLSADHRATDGHRGGQFLAAIERALGEPEKL